MIQPIHSRRAGRRWTWFALLVASGVLGFAAPLAPRTLEDGSVVELNHGAEIATHFTPTERRVTLLRGEVTFQVAKESKKPFIVAVGDVQMRALGTRFNVRCDTQEVQVTVLEGKVRVIIPADPTAGRAEGSRQDLDAGQRMVVALHPSP